MDTLFNFLKQYDGTTDPKEFVRYFKLQSAVHNWNDYKLSERFGSLLQILNLYFINKILNEQIIYTYIILLADFNFFIILFSILLGLPLKW